MAFIDTHRECPKCGSSDAVGLNDDGSMKCFSCGEFIPKPKGDNNNGINVNRNRSKLSVTRNARPGSKLTAIDIPAEVQPLRDRKITVETCEKFGYKVDSAGNHYAPYFKDGELVGQKKRFPNKDFAAIGKIAGSELFGQKVWRNTPKFNGKAKRLVITEGEIDCMSVAQAFNLSWPAVSIQNTGSVANNIRKNYKFICQFEEVVLCFDNDKPGKIAVTEAAGMLPQGICKVVEYPEGCKDASDVLVKHGGKAVASLIFNARDYRPDGIRKGSDLIENLFKHYDGELFPTGLALTNFPKLNSLTRGTRKGELWTFLAGTGCGKSTLVHDIGFDLWHTHKQKLAIIALEERVEFAALRYVSRLAKKRLNLDPKQLSRKKYEAYVREVLENDRLWFYDHGGQMGGSVILERLNYFARAIGVDYILYDHISMTIAATRGGEERRIIDNLVTDLRGVIDATGVGIHLISHVRKAATGQKTAEEGGRMRLSDIRGSGAIAQESDMVIGIERDTQNEGSTEATIRLMKNRLTGENGEADSYDYNRDTGLLDVCQKKATPYEEEVKGLF